MFELPPPRNVCSESKFRSFAKQNQVCWTRFSSSQLAINFLEDYFQSARILCTQHVSKVKINIWSCPPHQKENEAHLNLDSNHSEILKIQTYWKTIGDTPIFHFHPSTGWIGILKPGETSNVQSSGCWPTSYRINQRNSRSRTWKCSKSLTWSQHNLANIWPFRYTQACTVIYINIMCI